MIDHPTAQPTLAAPSSLIPWHVVRRRVPPIVRVDARMIYMRAVLCATWVLLAVAA